MKNRKAMYFFLAILMLAAAAVVIFLQTTGRRAVENPDDTSIFEDMKDFTLVGIGLADPSDRVLEQLGEPISRKTEAEPSVHNQDYETYWTTWTYAGLEVLFMNVAEKGKDPAGEIGGVFAVTVSTDRHATHRGVKVGDPASRVADRYGKDKNTVLSQSADEMYYETGAHYIRFAVSEGRVTRIEIGQVLN